MELESSFRPEEIESRGALCVECLAAVAPGDALVDRCGATLCRPCAAEFYAPCAACGRLLPRDEALARADAPEATLCADCFRAPSAAGGEAAPAPNDEEVATLVKRYIALHAEKKRLDTELDEIKEQLKAAAGARPRVAGAVVFRAAEGGVRCSYSVRTAWDAEKLSEVEALIGSEEFGALFERKLSFTAIRERLDGFLAAADSTHAEARQLVRAAAHESETVTLNVIASKKKKKDD